MTNREAIEKLEWVYQNGFDNDFEKDGTEYILDAIRKGINALEEADKYRWHDLKKDPTDLPPIDTKETVLGKVGNSYYVMEPVDGIGPMKGIRFWEFHNYDAWRYLESFEVKK